MAGTTAATAAAAAAPAAIMPIDSCDPKRMMFDSLDLLAHEIITNPSKRMERKGQLEYFLDRVGEPPSYGRLGSRIGLAVLLENFCSRGAYPRKDPPQGPPPSSDARPVALVRMSPDEWQQYARMLETVHDDVLRMDADAPILPEALTEQRPVSRSFGLVDDGDEEHEEEDSDGGANKDPRIVSYNQSLLNAASNSDLEDHVLFTRKYWDIKISLQFHRAMAGRIREVLEEVMATPGDVAETEDSDSEEENDDEEVPEISLEILVDFYKFVNENFSEDRGVGAKELLLKLIHVDFLTNGDAVKAIRLRHPSKLRKIYNRKEFGLNRFQRKVEKLMTKWNDVVLGVPRMVTMGYGPTVSPPVSEAERRAAVPERRVRVIEKERMAAKKAPAVAANDDDDDVAAPMPDDEEYEADKEQHTTTKKKRKKDKRTRRDLNRDGEQQATTKKSKTDEIRNAAASNDDDNDVAAPMPEDGGSDDVLSLVKMILKGPTPLDCATFLEYDTFHDDVERYGDLLAFGLLFESRWEEQRSKPGYVTLEDFLVTYGHNLGKVIPFLKPKAKHGSKYHGEEGYTKRILDDKAAEADRKQRWKANAAKVAADVHSKCVKGGIDSVNAFLAAVEIIGPVVNTVFSETAGFEVVTESCRRSFAAVLAAIHVGATSTNSEA